MKLSIIALSTVIASTSAFAQDSTIQFGSQECNIAFASDVRIEPQRIQITNASNQVLEYDTHALRINGQDITLNDQQRTAVRDYTEQLRSHMPEVANIALDGVRIAAVAIEEVTQAFGIDKNNTLQSTLENIGTQVQASFYQNGAFVMGKQSFDSLGQDIEQQFDSEFEDAVATVVSQSIGALLMEMGAQMMSSNDGMTDFEQRMENMGEQIELRVEQQAQNIEQRADKLCVTFTQLAEQEKQLSALVPQWQAYQLLESN